MFTASFWRQAAERAIKTFAQSAIAILSVEGLGLVDAPWPAVGSVAGLAAVVSILTSVASTGVGQPESPSAVAVESAPADR
ncbi:holin [Polymorphospora rubra]|uniref:holin n=1 Tax=Polymorphospora rubra TaxID=338584 RepID=UPI0033E46806